MNFQEYINQKNPKKARRILVTLMDISRIWKPTTTSTVIELKIEEEYYTYLLIDEALWTMDEDGNKKYPSCFYYKPFTTLNILNIREQLNKIRDYSSGIDSDLFNAITGVITSTDKRFYEDIFYTKNKKR